MRKKQYVIRHFRTEAQARAYRKMVERAGRIASEPDKTARGWTVASTSMKVILKAVRNPNRPAAAHPRDWRIVIQELSSRKEAEREADQERRAGRDAKITARTHPKSGRTTWTVWSATGRPRRNPGAAPTVGGIWHEWPTAIGTYTIDPYVGKHGGKVKGYLVKLGSMMVADVRTASQGRRKARDHYALYGTGRNPPTRPGTLIHRPGTMTKAAGGGTWIVLSRHRTQDTANAARRQAWRHDMEQLMVRRAPDGSWGLYGRVQRNPSRRGKMYIVSVGPYPELVGVTRDRAMAKAKELRRAGYHLVTVHSAGEGQRFKQIKRNPGTDMGSITRTPDFKRGLKLYHQIHGCDPKSIKRTILRMGPGDNKVTGRVVLVSMGKAPADSYEPPKGSRKEGRIWVHPYDNKPEKVVTVDGKTIITMPGTHGVKAGADGEAWIDG